MFVDRGSSLEIRPEKPAREGRAWLVDVPGRTALYGKEHSLNGKPPYVPTAFAIFTVDHAVSEAPSKERKKKFLVNPKRR
jgi:hypothetical protein